MKIVLMPETLRYIASDRKRAQKTDRIKIEYMKWKKIRVGGREISRGGGYCACDKVTKYPQTLVGAEAASESKSSLPDSQSASNSPHTALAPTYQ